MGTSGGLIGSTFNTSEQAVLGCSAMMSSREGGTNGEREETRKAVAEGT